MYQDYIVVDWCTKYEYNRPVLSWDITTNIKFKKNIAIITKICLGAKILFCMHQQHMVCDYCTNYEYIQLILQWDIRNTQNVWKSGHNYSNYAQSQMLFNKYEQHMVPDYCMKKITTFFSGWLHFFGNKLKLGVTTLGGAKYMHFIHFAYIFFSKISQQSLKIYETIAIIYSNFEQSQILFYVHQQPMVPDHGTQFEENPSCHRKARLTYRAHSNCLYSLIPLMQSGE